MARNRNSAKQAKNKTPVKCEQCGEVRYLLHPKMAGSMCRTCAAKIGTVAAREVNTQDLEERFMRYVLKADGGCWEWIGSLQKNGYSTLHVEGKTLRGHRVSYELFIGKIPDGLHIDHLCRNRKCVNPEHLEAVTSVENTRRAMRTRCVNGHEFTEDNIYWWTDGKRYCKTCRRNRNREYQERNIGTE